MIYLASEMKCNITLKKEVYKKEVGGFQTHW